MDPEVRESKPGSCPICGMALEPEDALPKPDVTEYFCPMHLQIVRSEPGNCPICGMTLEPRTVAAKEENPELDNMTRRFWIGMALAVPVFVMAMAADMWMGFAPQMISFTHLQWIEFLLATPVVLWCGWPFFQRGWASVVSWHLNMFTLIALGVGVAWSYSVVGTFLPDIFPATLAPRGWHAADLFRGCGDDHRAGVAGAGAGAESAQPHQHRDQIVAGSGAQDRAHRASGCRRERRQGRRHSAGAGAGRRCAARAPRRKDPGGWSGCGRQQCGR